MKKQNKQIKKIKKEISKVPFSKTTLGDEEIKAISDCIKSGWVVLGDKSQEFEEKFAEYVGAKHAVFVDSGTSALFLAVQYLIKEGKIKRSMHVPSLTFTASAEVIENSGLAVQFEDVDLKSFCMDEDLRDSIGVHLTGNKCKSNSLIYDSAHRIERNDVKDSPATWCYSFYATKNITTVQGGMIATNDERAYNWFKLARDHGLDLGTKERYTGKYKQYDVTFIGYRVKGDDLRAVIGLEQLKKLPEMTEKRNAIVKKYNEAFDLEHKGNHVYPVLVDKRDKFMDKMAEDNIQVSVHFRPLHLMTGYSKYKVSLRNTEFIGERICSLPIFPQMTIKEQDYVIEKVLKTKLLCRK